MMTGLPLAIWGVGLVTCFLSVRWAERRSGLVAWALTVLLWTVSAAISGAVLAILLSAFASIALGRDAQIRADELRSTERREGKR